MVKKKERETELPEGVSRIGCHIKKTRVALRHDNSSIMDINKGSEPNYQIYEYTHGSRRVFIAGMYLYLLTKLIVLYVAKGVWWAIHPRKPEGDKPKNGNSSLKA